MTFIFLIFIVITLSALYDFKNAVLIYASLRLILNDMICLRYESPSIAIDFACCTLFFFIYVIKYGKKNTNFPLSRIFKYTVLSLILSIVVSQYPITRAAPFVFGKIVTLLFSVVFFTQLQNYKDARKFIGVFFVVVGLMTSYGVYEYIMQTNPYIDYFKSFVSEDLQTSRFITSSQLRSNSIRLQSLAQISISFGIICALWLCTLFCVFKKMLGRIAKVLSLCIIPPSLIGCYFCGSKASVLCILVYLFLYLMLNKGGKSKIALIFITAIAMIFLSAELYDFVISIFDSSKGSSNGSDLIMRLMQVEAAISVVGNNIIWGVGAKGVAYAQDANPLVLGAESIWLQKYIEEGLIGVTVYLITMIKLYRYAKSNSQLRYDKRLKLCVLVISWTVTNTVTTMPGVDLTFFLCLYFAMIKIFDESRERYNIEVIKQTNRENE